MTDVINQSNNVNPLMDYARKTECSVKLPSQGLWYDNDSIQFNPIGEVDIKPMLPTDEMLIVNPETLVSGDAIISLIKSCCPSIKHPEELYYPDVNTILLGIKKATYGDDITQQYVCPMCWSKKMDIEGKELERIITEKYGKDYKVTEQDIQELKSTVEDNCKTEIANLEREGKILITPQDYKISCEYMLNTMTFLPKESFVETPNGLKIYTTPYKCIDKIKFTTQQIKFQKLAKYYENEKKKYIDVEDVNKDYLLMIDKMLSMYSDITNITLDILASSIKKVVLPNGNEVTDRNYILEFIKNSNVDIINKIKSSIDDLNDAGIKQIIPMECTCCGYKWDEKFYGFNQVDFFRISS